MSAEILKGKPVSDKIREKMKNRARSVAEKFGSPPHLAVLAIGGDPTSQLFLRQKLQACKKVGIDCTVESLPENISETDILRLLQKLGKDTNLDGIILDTPIPAHIDAGRVVEAISPDKDVEGVTTANTGRLFAERTYAGLKKTSVLIPCTANSVICLLQETGVELRGLEAVVVGRSNIVGRPVAHLLACLDATVTLCHSGTRDLRSHVARADILVTAIGKSGVVKGEWIKPGAIAIDAGVHSEGGLFKGDLDFEASAARAAFLTPVPGGVGPLTVTFLIYNTVLAAELRTKRQFGS